MKQPSAQVEAPLNFARGAENSMSRRNRANGAPGASVRVGSIRIPSHGPFDVPWLVLDSRAAGQRWQRKPQKNLQAILEEIALHAEQQPDWLDLTSA